MRKPWLAALLSFICPGMGQLYNGNLIWALWAIPLTILLSVFGSFFLFDSFAQLMIALFLGFVVDAVFAVQAWREAKQTNGSEPRKWFQRWWIYPIYMAVLYGLPGGYGLIIPDRMLSFQIPSESMVPNLLVGDRLVADGWAYWGKDPKRGDIITFKYPKDPSLVYVKRLVGLPGDTVELKDGELYINDQLQKQEPMEASTKPRCRKTSFL
jgi:signal peptidase I